MAQRHKKPSKAFVKRLRDEKGKEKPNARKNARQRDKTRNKTKTGTDARLYSYSQEFHETQDHQA